MRGRIPEQHNYMVPSGDMFRSNDSALTWTKLSTRPITRYGAACTVLENGKVMVAGDSYNAGTFNSVELYEIKKDIWTNAASMRRQRQLFQVVPLPNSVDDLVAAWGGGGAPTHSKLSCTKTASCTVWQ